MTKQVINKNNTTVNIIQLMGLLTDSDFAGSLDVQDINTLQGKIPDAKEIKTLLNSINSDLNSKVDNVSGKGLSTEDYTTSEKTKLANIEAEANKTIVDSTWVTNSTNPVESKLVKGALDNKANSSDIPTKTSDLTNDGDGTNVFVKDNDSRLSDARTPASHTHGNIQNDGKIKISGTAQASKNVVTDSNGNITTENKPTIPTKTSDLTNDGNSSSDSLIFVETSSTAGLLKNDGTVDTNTYLTQHQDISGKADTSTVNAIDSRVTALENSEFNIVFKSSFSQLPSTGRTHTLYYVSNGDPAPNAYDEYTWNGTSYELMGSKAIDLSGYVQISNLPDYIGAEIDSNGDFKLVFTSPS